MHKSLRLREAVMQLYSQLEETGIEVLLDDRKERPGVMFADAELIGIPHRLIFSESGLDNGMVEYKSRQTGEEMEISLVDVADFIKSRF